MLPFNTKVSITLEEKNFLVEKLLNDQVVSITDFGDLMIDIIRQRQRVFNYGAAFPAADPACAPGFGRSFIHQDWVDGESVVQAEQSTGEEGFNARFHKIEADLDALGADVARAYLCLAQMRTGLSALLDELRTEINRINSDVFACCQKDQGGGVVIDPGFFDGAFLGVSRFKDGDYLVYEKAGHYTLLPKVNPPDIIKPVDPLEDFRIRNVQGFARLLMDPQVRDTFGNNPLTKEELVARFGDREVREGVKVKDIAPILPPGQFANLRALSDAFAERSAAAINLSGGRETVATFFGVGTDVGTTDEASVDKLSMLPAKTGDALKAVGVDTVGGLAGADPTALARRLGAAGIQATTADTAAWVSAARALTLITRGR